MNPIGVDKHNVCAVLQRLSNVDLDPPTADFLLCFGPILTASDKVFFFPPLLKSNY